jgi:predicted nuclease of restriction endonuclease-like RecB superfamily
VRVCAVEERGQTVDELEQKLQEREILDDLRLERELAGLATRESSLERCEAALSAEQRDFEDTCASVLAAEVADRETLLAEQQMQELAAA